MPRAGCTGVDNWHTSFCGYEDIWDAAWEMLTTGPLKAQKAMAINPAHRRTQHQVRCAPAGSAVLCACPCCCRCRC